LAESRSATITSTKATNRSKGTVRYWNRFIAVSNSKSILPAPTKPTTREELKILRRQSQEGFDNIGEVSDEIRAILARNWPLLDWLALVIARCASMALAAMSVWRHSSNISIDGHFSVHGMPDQPSIMPSACSSTR
jgi:hypothetical protein